MWKAPQGIHAFLRAYYHIKSADWKQNELFKLASFTAGELTKMPTYYIMDLDKGMAETVAPEMPSAAEIPVASGFRTRSWPCTQPNGIGPVFRAVCSGIGARLASTLPSLKPFPAARLMFRPVSSPVRATGLSTTRPVRLRECKLLPVPDGVARTWSRTPDTGWGRSSPSKWEDCF